MTNLLSLGKISYFDSNTSIEMCLEPAQDTMNCLLSLTPTTRLVLSLRISMELISKCTILGPHISE